METIFPISRLTSHRKNVELGKRHQLDKNSSVKIPCKNIRLEREKIKNDTPFTFLDRPSFQSLTNAALPGKMKQIILNSRSHNSEDLMSLIDHSILDTQVSYMLFKEIMPKNILKENFLTDAFNSVYNSKNDRSTMVKFCLYLMFRLESTFQVFLEAVALMDHYLQKKCHSYELSKNAAQSRLIYSFLSCSMGGKGPLLISVCFLLASKYTEIMPAPIDDFIYLITRKFSIKFNRTTFTNLERDVLSTLDFNLTRPTMIDSIEIFHKIPEFSAKKKYSLVKLIAVCIQEKYEFCHVCPSLQGVICQKLADQVYPEVCISDVLKVFQYEDAALKLVLKEVSMHVIYVLRNQNKYNPMVQYTLTDEARSEVESIISKLYQI